MSLLDGARGFMFDLDGTLVHRVRGGSGTDGGYAAGHWLGGRRGGGRFTHRHRGAILVHGRAVQRVTLHRAANHIGAGRLVCSLFFQTLGHPLDQIQRGGGLIRHSIPRKVRRNDASRATSTTT